MTDTTTFKQLAAADVLAERYSVSKLVASNEYANVYKAFDIVNDGVPVAIKTINSKAGSDGVALELFNREVDSLSRLRHERIVRLLDFGNSPVFGQWLALEWMDGGSLQDAAMRQRLATADGQVATLRALLEALSFAHLNHILHRDIKPANILYTRDGTAKLADFNVSMIIRRASAARTVKHIYTAEYASPEQLAGKPVTERSDVFSLGKVIAELITAATANPNDVGLLQLLDATACPGPLKRELKKMLAPVPTDRPTAAEALREIEALIRSQRPMPAVFIRVVDKVLQAMTLRAGKPQTPHEQRQALEHDLAGPLVCKLRTKESPKGGTTYTLIGRHYTYLMVTTENDLGALSGLLITSVAPLDAAWEDRNRAGAVELPLTMRSVAKEGFADFAGDAHAFVECHRHACA
ncbi:MAG: serine/threonine protein kinase, partial [Gemmatimonadaceae bacterium]|nr:serine/threonine protein kinase [Gemmatimonadaceae bacterium]